MFQNYIFDFGQVLIHFVPHRIVSDFEKNPQRAELLTRVLFDRLYWGSLDAGNISDEELIRKACLRLPDQLHQKAVEIYDNWFQTRPQIQGMEEVVDEIKKSGKKLYLLSNISAGFAKNYHKTPHLNRLLGKFDGHVFSGVVHMVKPQEGIYRHLLEKYSLDPKECLFIDDSQKNLDGAARLGIRGYLFDGDAEKLRKYIFE